MVPIMRLCYRVRAVCKFGIGNYFRVCFAKSENKGRRHFLSVLVCAKDEATYLTEWLEYHLMLGVEKFYFYDNESTDNTREVLAPYIARGTVEYIFWRGRKQQMAMYADALRRFSDRTEWLAIIDIDEFINPITFDDIPSFLNKVPRGATQIYLAWDNFGSSGHKKRPDGLVIENYKYYNNAPRGKSLVNPRAVVGLSNPHMLEVIGDTVDENFRPFRFWDWVGKIAIWPGREFPRSKIKINHYQLKSLEEFLAKQVRGRANGKEGDVAKYSATAFAAKDTGHHLDKSILRFVPALKQQINSNGQL